MKRINIQSPVIVDSLRSNRNTLKPILLLVYKVLKSKGVYNHIREVYKSLL
jgi:hypothetical protein